MTARVRIRDAGGTLRTINGTGSSRIRMRDAGNTLRTISRIRMRDAGNVLRVVYDVTGSSSFSATASPSTVAGVGLHAVTTNATTVTPTGGVAPYFHAWTRYDYTDATPPTITSPSSATTTFHQTNLGPSDIESATFLDTVTDSATPANTTTVYVSAVFQDTSTL